MPKNEKWEFDPETCFVRNHLGLVMAKTATCDTAQETEQVGRLVAAAPALFAAVEAVLNLDAGIELPSGLVQLLSNAANLADPK